MRQYPEKDYVRLLIVKTLTRMLECMQTPTHLK